MRTSLQGISVFSRRMVVPQNYAISYIEGVYIPILSSISAPKKYEAP